MKICGGKDPMCGENNTICMRRAVGIKIMPTGVKPERFLAGFAWQDTIWRRGELLSQVPLALLPCCLPDEHPQKSSRSNCS